ncbi:hypothetical protein SLA2020_270630 [Shorea laevis]
MATTKGKDSSRLGKEKRVLSPPNSRTTNITKPRPKTPTTSTAHHKASSTTTEKQVPSYLRPTISSRHDQSLRYVKKSVPEDSPQKTTSLNRRRSFDKAPPAASRLQTFICKGNEEGTTPAIKKEDNASASASTSEKAPHDVDIMESFNLNITEQDDEEFLVHEVEEIVEVEDPSSEIPKCENDDEHSNVIDSDQVGNGEDEKVKLCDIPEVAEEKANPLIVDIQEFGDKLQEEKAENQHEGEENGSNEIHLEESEATVEVKEDKGEECVEDKEFADENKHMGNMVDGGSEELILKEEENVEGGGVEETKTEVANNIEISSKEDQNVDGGVEVITKPEVTNITTAISSKHQAGLAGKKESPPAYNDVIEETASKLLEKRKNKVKALVGAFETVIDKEASSK